MPYPDTVLEAVVDAVVQQLPPMRRLNTWWRTRPRRLKAIYYVACIVVIIVGGRYAGGIAPPLEAQAAGR